MGHYEPLSWVCAKRLEKGRFRWPVAEREQAKVVLSHEEMALLLAGIDLAGSRRRAWFRKTVGEESTRKTRINSQNAAQHKT